MKAVPPPPRAKRSSWGGFTLLELIVAATILSILTLMALPLARVAIQREKEKQLRRALWEMRDANRADGRTSARPCEYPNLAYLRPALG